MKQVSSQRYHTNAEGHRPALNRQIHHCMADALTGPWSVPQCVFEANEQAHERYLFPPHVLVHDGTFYMYYGAGWDSGDYDHIKMPVRLHLATSEDGVRWQRFETLPLFTLDTDPGNPWIVRYKDRWIMFVGTPNGVCEGEHCETVLGYRTSSNLIHWSPARSCVSLETPNKKWGSGHNQVFKYQDHWYMIFLSGGNNFHRGGRYGRMRHAHSALLRSKELFRWEWTLDGKRLMNNFGSVQVLRDDDGTWYITHGGPVPTIDGPAGLWIAPIQFVP